MKMRRAIIGLVTVATMLLSGCSSNSVSLGGTYVFLSPGGQTAISYPIGERGTVGEFSGQDLLEDRTIGIADYRGQVVVVNYWGSWCSPCREEVDDLNTAYELTKDSGVAFLGVNVAESRSNGADFAREKQVPYPSISDAGRRTLLAFRGIPANTTPMTFVLDRDLQVAKLYLRGVTLDELVPVIKAVAEEDSTASS